MTDRDFMKFRNLEMFKNHLVFRCLFKKSTIGYHYMRLSAEQFSTNFHLYKFRCGVAPIKLKTCRYGLNRVPVDQRLCEECNVVEDECHVIMCCSLYTDTRDQLFKEICDISSLFPT